jgi:hypothetical protein
MCIRDRRKLEDIEVKEIDELELDQAEIDFLKKLFTDSLLVPPHLSKYFIILEEEIKKL